MCLSWIQACTAIHLLWSVLYISVGAVQIVAGIFFLFTIPVLRIGSNIWTGSWVNNNNTIMIIICEKCMKQMTRLYFVIDDDIKKICGSRSAVIDTGHRYNGRVKFDFNDMSLYMRKTILSENGV